MVRLPLTVLGALFLAFLIACGAFELIDLGSRRSFDVSASYAGVRSLEVDGGPGGVSLGAAPGGSALVVVEHVTEGLSTPDRIAVRGAGGALRLSATCSLGISNYCWVGYTIAVPPGVAVNAGSGEGDVVARGLSTTAPLRLSSGDGDVSALGVSAGNVTLQSGNGDVTATLDRAPTQLQAVAGNGDVTLTVPNATYAVHASAGGNGTLSDGTLRTDPSSPRTITASSGNGDVTVTAAGAASG